MAKRSGWYGVMLALLLWAVPVQAQEMAVFVGTEASGNKVVINKGMTVKLLLPGNGATGHRWEVLADGAPVLAREGEISYVAEGASATEGGRFIAVFRAQQGGETRIRLAYHRPADRGQPPLRTYELPVGVAQFFSSDDVLRTLDPDGDGRITSEEFMRARAVPALVNAKGHVVLQVGNMPRDGKGEIDRNALRRSLFKDMDLNRDGVVDRLELQQAVGHGFVMLAW